MYLFSPLDCGDDIVLLAFSFVMLASTRPGSSKIEPQRREVRVLEAARRAENDFVVQRAAAKGMRVADDGDADRILQLAIKRFQAAGAAVEIDMTQRLRIQIHVSLTRTRSPSTRTSCVAIRISGLPTQTPVSISNDQRCHGQTISLAMMSPSPSGPPRCGHVFSVAKKPLGM